jgi:hypothetical protein
VRLQLISDLHLETEDFQPEPAPGAEALVLAGDVDSGWAGLRRFAGWPVPVLFVPGNHEYDGRDFDAARAGLHALAAELGFVMLDDAVHLMRDAQGRRVRFVGSTRWCDFDLFGASQRERALRAGSYFQRVMNSSRHGRPFDAPAVREQALSCRAWLQQTLAAPESGPDWEATVVITHFGPSIQSADPRYGRQPGTASFCNNDEDLLPRARLWVHGHLHCRHDYHLHGCHVVCNARGHSQRGEALNYDGGRCVEVFAN